MTKPTICFDDVRWREADQGPTEASWEVNQSCPAVGDSHWVLLRHDKQWQVHSGDRLWLMFQPTDAYINGFETEEEVAASAVVEVEPFEQMTPHDVTRRSLTYWAKVAILNVVPVVQIPQAFPQSRPSDWPRGDRGVQIREMGQFVYYSMPMDGADWFITTRGNHCRMILRAYHPNCFDDPIEICNCAFDVRQWPHLSRS